MEKGLTFDNIAEVVAAIKYDKLSQRKSLDRTQLDILITTAQRAGSAGNNQPWKWYYHQDTLFLFHDKERSFSFANHQNSVAYVAFGLSLESLRLKAGTMGLDVNEQLFSDPEHPDLVAALQFLDLQKSDKADDLANFVEIRHTSRNIPKEKKPITKDKIDKLVFETEKIEGAKLYVTDSEEHIGVIANVMGAADRLRLFTPTGHHELFNLELRWTRSESLETGDGLDLSSFDLTPGEAVGMRIARDPEVLTLLKEWKGGTGLEKISKKSAIASAAIGLITVPAYDSENFIKGGKAAERAWLAANIAGISLQPMTASILHFNILKYGKELDNDPFLKDQFIELKTQFFSCFSEVGPDEVPVFLFRLFYADQESIPSARLEREKVFRATKHI
ncbi:MAG: hypothetical protein EOO18_12465 [Chryseobacterium sp.]|nr:MAG: hypothetical protein EOO18_12465 [Chryseobacterium sp.]